VQNSLHHRIQVRAHGNFKRRCACELQRAIIRDLRLVFHTEGRVHVRQQQAAALAPTDTCATAYTQRGFSGNCQTYSPPNDRDGRIRPDAGAGSVRSGNSVPVRCGCASQLGNVLRVVAHRRHLQGMV
jgi:hypothetical protein